MLSEARFMLCLMHDMHVYALFGLSAMLRERSKLGSSACGLHINSATSMRASGAS